MELTTPAQAIPAQMVWDLIVRDHVAPDTDPAEICRRYGFAPEIQYTRDFIKMDFELRKEFLRWKSLAHMQLNLDSMFDAVRVSTKVAERAEYHNIVSKIAGFGDRPTDQSGAGQPFVLTINVPGTAPVQMGAVIEATKPASQLDLQTAGPALLKAVKEDKETPGLDERGVLRVLPIEDAEDLVPKEAAHRQFSEEQLSVNADLAE